MGYREWQLYKRAEELLAESGTWDSAVPVTATAHRKEGHREIATLANRMGTKNLKKLYIDL